MLGKKISVICEGLKLLLLLLILEKSSI